MIFSFYYKWKASLVFYEKKLYCFIFFQVDNSTQVPSSIQIFFQAFRAILELLAKDLILPERNFSS